MIVKINAEIFPEMVDVLKSYVTVVTFVTDVTDTADKLTNRRTSWLRSQTNRLKSGTRQQ